MSAERVDRSPTRTILGPGSVFAGTSAAGRAVMFLLLPLFTRVLTPAEYGELSILLSTYAVAIVLFAFGTEITIFRTVVHLEDEPDRLRNYVSQVWTFLIAAPLLLAAVASAIAFPLLVNSSLITPLEFVMALIWAALFVGATTLPFALLRAENRLADFVRLNVVNAFVTPALIVVALVVFDAGVVGWMIASAIGSLAMLGLGAWIVPYSRPGQIDWNSLKDVLKVSLPVVPHFLSMWSLQLADRLLLAALVTTSALGVYSLAGNAALPVVVILSGINQALMADYARAGKSAVVGRVQRVNLRRTIELQVACVALVSVACAVLAPVAINVFLDSSFHASAGLVPWIALGYALLGLEAIPMNGITLTHGHSKWIWIASLAAAAANLLGIYLFTERYGLVAAAIASAVGYGVLLVAVEAYSRAIRAHLEYPWMSIFVTAGTSLAAYFAISLTIADDSFLELLLRVAGVGLFAAIVGGIVGRDRLFSAFRAGYRGRT